MRGASTTCLVFGCFHQASSDSHSSIVLMRRDVVDMQLVLDYPTCKKTDHRWAHREVARDDHYGILIGEQLALVRIITPSVESAGFFDLNYFDQITLTHGLDRVVLEQGFVFPAGKFANRHRNPRGPTSCQLVDDSPKPLLPNWGANPAACRTCYSFMLR